MPTTLLPAVLAVLSLSSPSGDEWPHLRGPDLDGRAHGLELPGSVLLVGFLMAAFALYVAAVPPLLVSGEAAAQQRSDPVAFTVDLALGKRLVGSELQRWSLVRIGQQLCLERSILERQLQNAARTQALARRLARQRAAACRTVR